ncbi:uncharacterized protein LOC132617146 isoform X2 [Lycium barbarum]|uniref:uncharacterized protein LOC132617146 isoform X2 n=1 Tax=Lycium barbarum TaxID=112863 RepID=UPI00293E1AC6|nr:uncharacterized protein LOC132617146 isoform X2 [Lycium barbarum]
MVIDLLFKDVEIFSVRNSIGITAMSSIPFLKIKAIETQGFGGCRPTCNLAQMEKGMLIWTQSNKPYDEALCKRLYTKGGAMTENY